LGRIEVYNWQEVLVELERKEKQSTSHEIWLFRGGKLFKGDEIFEGEWRASEYRRYK